ncbi:MAG: hypothetical protein AABW50_02060 [Nanoarchaeota archaeon]
MEKTQKTRERYPWEQWVPVYGEYKMIKDTNNYNIFDYTDSLGEDANSLWLLNHLYAFPAWMSTRILFSMGCFAGICKGIESIVK